MPSDLFDAFFQGEARTFLDRAIDMALEEDGPDLTSEALFTDTDILAARVVAKEEAVVAGLPILPRVAERMGQAARFSFSFPAPETSRVAPGTIVARLSGPAAAVLKAERIMLNFLTHLSGVATATAACVAAVAGTRTRVLDTRKTLPGLRYPEKYAVLAGGGRNHRKNLAEMLMLKDNHNDRAGGIGPAMAALRRFFAARKTPMPPVEIECRSLDEVNQAVAERPARIMLDNMDRETMKTALAMIPATIETELSGGVTIEKLPELAALGADFISIGRITHSARAADMSLLIERNATP